MEITTADPEITTAVTAAPEITTAVPEITTAVPEITTAVPEITAAAPEITTAVPEITTAVPEILVSIDGEKPLIIVGMHDTERSNYALEWTLDQYFVPFKSTKDYPYRLLIVLAQRSIGSRMAATYGGFGSPGHVYNLTAVQHIYEAHTKAMETQVNNVKKYARALCKDKLEKGFRFSYKVMENSYETAMDLCEAVKVYGASLLVVGSSQRGWFTRIFNGSVGEYCVRKAKCGVVVARKPVLSIE